MNSSDLAEAIIRQWLPNYDWNYVDVPIRQENEMGDILDQSEYVKQPELDIDTMSAGRELDAMVAEKVMGWKADFDETWMTPNGILGKENWQPSVDIAAAWQVVEKLIAQSKGWSMNEGGGFYCDFGDSLANAETAPLAICRAALKAVMDE